MTKRAMNRFRTKLLSALLAVCMLVSTMGMAAFAAADDSTGTVKAAEVTETIAETDAAADISKLSEDAAETEEVVEMPNGAAAENIEPAGETDKAADSEMPPEGTGAMEDAVEPVEETDETEDTKNPVKEADETEGSEAPAEGTGTAADAVNPTEGTGPAVEDAEGNQENVNVTEEVPEAVVAFLNAVAALPSSDMITPLNAEEIGGQVNAVIDMWDALDASLGGRADVTAAMEKVYAVYEAVLAAEGIEEAEHYLNSIPGMTPADRFYYNGKEVAQLYIGTYPNNPIYSYVNPATQISTKVGETGSDQRVYTKMATCHCGNVLVEVTPDWIAVDPTRKLSDGNPGIVENLTNAGTWCLAAYEPEGWEDRGYRGFPALQLNVVGAKPGHTTLTFQTYQNYYYAYSWQRCSACGHCSCDI